MAAGEPAFYRVSDPVNPAKRAFRHRIKPQYPEWARGWLSKPTWRSEVSAPGGDSGFTVVRGHTYWIGYAVKLDPDVVNGRNAVSLFDLHAADGSNNGGPSPLSITAGAGVLTVWRSWNATYKGNAPGRETWTLPAGTEWMFLVMQVRVHWDAAQAPFVRIWRADGEAELAKVIDRVGPIGYNEDANSTAQKFGLYMWDAWDGDPQQTRGSHTKGLFVFRDDPDPTPIDEHAMLALLRSI